MDHNSRYIRQIILDRFGSGAQDRLRMATVAVVGCGGLGSVAAPYLAGAGVGHLVLIDGDSPHITNLHRQVFFQETPTTMTKSEAIATHITKLNSDIKTTVVTEMISKDNIAEHLGEVDLVLECTDNIQAKYLVNDYCHLYQIPMVYGAIHKYDGFVSFFDNAHPSSIHLRDIFPVISDDIPTCSEVGVLGTLAGLIGILQATEAIKHITTVGDGLSGKMLSYDVLSSRQLIINLTKNWTEDISDVYASSTYASGIDSCSTVPTISYQRLQDDPRNFKIISVLERDEIVHGIDSELQYPMSEVNNTLPDLSTDIEYAVYCMSGIRSAQFVRLMLDHNPALKLHSIEGGVLEINKSR